MTRKSNSTSPFSEEQHRVYFQLRLPQERLNGHRETSVHCPFHDDDTPSMSINIAKGVWNCHSGCGGGGVLQFEERISHCDHETARRNVAELLGQPIPQSLRGGSTLDFAGSKRVIAIYEYWDEHKRNLIFKKVRYSDKSFTVWRKVGESWVPNLDGLQEKPLYGHPGLITADTVFVAEGEKDCDRLSGLRVEEIYPHLRFAYVTNFDGAGHWRPSYAKYFAGKDVVIFGDNDEAGKKHVRDIARSLTGFATGIRVVEFPELPEKGDVSDWLDLHSDNEGDLQRALFERIEKSPVWKDDPSEEWKALFHCYIDIINAPPVSFGIDGFLPNDGITLIGGPPQNAKTLLMLAMGRALLEGGRFLHHFAVNRVAERVLYLIPECGLSPFAHRLKLFHLTEYIRDQKLFVHTLSTAKPISLKDPQLLEAAKGADVFLDTAVRFMEGDENSAGEQRQFAELLFDLQRAGARTIIGAHHSPKSFARDNFMSLENILRGSGDLGAMLVACWGLSQIDPASNQVFVQNVKARDFSPCEPLIIQGRPSIDQTGYFELISPPGFAGSYADAKTNKGGRPQMFAKDEKIAEAKRLHALGKSYREIAEVLEVSVGTVSGWLKPVQ